MFPEEPDYDLAEFKKSTGDGHGYRFMRYWIVDDGKDDVGMCGLYSADETACWLGWFGIRPGFRRRGYAAAMFRRMEDVARGMDYKEFRLYTDKVFNRVAYDMYVRRGMREDGIYFDDFVTMSKSLVEGHVAAPWKGKPIGFESQPPPAKFYGI